MQKSVVVAFALSVWIAPATAVHAEGKAGDPALKGLDAELTTLFQKHFPKVAIQRQGKNDIRFEYDVTTFEIPYTGRPGAKHESTKQRGPKKGGILCIVYVEKGDYRGQRLLMKSANGQREQLQDKKAYKQLIMAPYSAKKDAHLWVVLAYPSDANDDFIKQFRALITDFEKYIG